jgi:hypothetical protein
MGHKTVMAAGMMRFATVGDRIIVRVAATECGCHRRLAEVVVPVSIVSFVVPHTYVEKPRQPNDDIVIHAMCAELWVGSEPTRLWRQRGTIALTQPQHTFGLPPRLVKDYARQLLEALYQQYGNGRRSGFERFAREEQGRIGHCAICPCSYPAWQRDFGVAWNLPPVATEM